MKSLKKLALGALMLAGAAVGVSAPANAGVSVGIGIGIPGPAYYGPAYSCDPYYDYYDPYGCGAYYTGPVFIGGSWYNGPLRWRWWGGHRQFWYHGGWRVGTGWHSGGFHGHGFRPGLHSSFHGAGWHGGGFRGPTLHSGFHGGGFHGRPTVGHFGGGSRGPTLHSGFHGGSMHGGGGGHRR
jgi:hypothetical protein